MISSRLVLLRGARSSSAVLRRRMVVAAASSESARSSSLAPHRLAMMTTSRRCLSSSSSTDALADLLKREYDEEMENETMVLPEELQTLQQTIEKDWKLVSEGSMTKLYKTLENGLKVQVSFHCQDSVESVEDGNFDEDVEDEEEEGGGEDEEEPTAFRFTVTATKAGRTVVMNCVSEYAAPRIEGIYVSSLDVDKILANDTDTSDYQGPEFDELASDLKEAYLVFLQETIGINQDVASFIAMYADYKEQCGYVEFLDDCKNILS